MRWWWPARRKQVQRARVLARPGMTAEKFDALQARQMPDAEKRQQAHYVVMTDKGLDHAREQVKMILADITEQSFSQCVKSFSTPKPRASSRATATASSRSAASS